MRTLLNEIFCDHILEETDEFFSKLTNKLIIWQQIYKLLIYYSHIRVRKLRAKDTYLTLKNISKKAI